MTKNLGSLDRALQAARTLHLRPRARRSDIVASMRALEPGRAATLTAAVNGGDAALGALVRLYHARLWRFGRRVCRDDFDADDAVQEAFVKLARSANVQQEESLERYRLGEVVRDAIAGLEPSLRAVVILRDVEGLTGPEMGASLGLSDAAMKSRLHRARAELRARLGPLVTGF